MIRVLLVTTWNTACGIAEHAAMLKEAVEAADPEIVITPSAEALDPRAPSPFPYKGIEILHLNYQASLHSRWTPEIITETKANEQCKAVVITYHDTGVPNSDQCKALHQIADAFVIHEPADDLPGAHYWRMGVPAWMPPTQFAAGLACRESNACFKGWGDQPVLGSLGFPFPWKHYEKLAEVSRAAGWALLLIAPGATEAQVAEWWAINPDLYVRTDFVSRREAISLLSGCDGTAFCYVTHNTGQAAPILLGIAARKPVIALSTCRQFRALYEDKLGRAAIGWCETYEDVLARLASCPIQRVDPGIVALAEQDSWTKLGQKYAALYHSLVS